LFPALLIGDELVSQVVNEQRDAPALGLHTEPRGDDLVRLYGDWIHKDIRRVPNISIPKTNDTSQVTGNVEVVLTSDIKCLLCCTRNPGSLGRNVWDTKRVIEEEVFVDFSFEYGSRRR